MGIIVNQNENRSQLQEKLAAELQEKAKKRAINTTRVDGVEDMTLIENTKKTGSLGWLKAIIGIAVLLALVWLASTFMSR
jgi:hypothetical protein